MQFACDASAFGGDRRLRAGFAVTLQQGAVLGQHGGVPLPGLHRHPRIT